MVSSLEIRKKLAEFFERRTPLEEFENWLVQESWNAHLLPDEATARLVYELELLFAEHSNGHLTVEDLRRNLAPFLQNYEVLVSLPETAPRPEIATGSTCSVSFQGPLIQFFDIRPAAVYV